MENKFLEIYEKIKNMANIVFDMWIDTHKAFMEHNKSLVDKILAKEDKVNLLEKDITFDLVKLGRQLDKTSQEKIIIYADIVEDLELIADYCKDILERIEIKIEEKLLFSEDAVAEYNAFHKKTTEFLSSVIDFLNEKNKGLISEYDLSTDLEILRENHKKRLLDGRCNPLASNMYINIVDFTFAVFEHSKRLYLNLKKLQ